MPPSDMRYAFETNTLNLNSFNHLNPLSFKIGKSNNRKVPNMDVLRKHLLREGHLNKPELLEIIKEATTIMSK